MDLKEIKTKTIRSVVALTFRTAFLQAVSFVSFFFLGVFLPPEAIGVFIGVSALMRIFNYISDLGIGAALIQKKDELDKEDLKTAFTLQITIVSFLVIIGFLLTPFVSNYAKLDTKAIFLYQVLLFTLFLSSLKTIPSILLERRLAFERQIIPQMIESVLFNILVVFLAYKGFGISAYSWSVLVSSLVGLPVYYLVSPWKISLGFSKGHAQKHVLYGIPFQGKNLLAVLKDDLLTFVLTGIIGTLGVGYWGWAQRWAYSPLRFLVDSVNKVTFPAYARLQHDTENLKKGIEKSLFGVSFTLFPVLTLTALLMNDFIHLVPKYTKWQPSLLSFYFLCAQAAISGLSNILVNALDATGRVKTTLCLMVMWVILTWGLTILFVWQFNYLGVAIAQFFVSLSIVLTVYLVKKIVPFSFWGSIKKSIVSSVTMGLIILSLKHTLPNNFISFTSLIFTGVIIYLLISFTIAKRELQENLRIIFQAYKDD